MKIAAVCCTYRRPESLGQLIHCFLQQDYPARLRELVILDDAGQYDDQAGDGWRLVSTAKRFPTLAQKRNAAVRLVSADVEALAVWDDDDVYLPWALQSSAQVLDTFAWSRPSVVLHPNPDGSLRQHLTGGLFHAGWAYRRDWFATIGGYPPERNNGEDQGLAARFEAAGALTADPVALGCKPFYVYRWGRHGSWHLSGLGPRGYEKLGDLTPVEKTALTIAPPPDVEVATPRIVPGVRPRMF